MSELKSCPHCGNSDHLMVGRVEGETLSPDNFQVVCSWLSGGCGASGGVRRTEAEAIAAWNRRANDANECEPTETYCCTCGQDLVFWDMRIGANGGVTELDPPELYNYCPNCGAKVRKPEPQVIKNAENYKLADDSRPQVIANAEKYELADSREKLEEAMRNVIRDALMNLKTAIMCCVEQGMDVLSFDEAEFVDYEPGEYVDEYLSRAMRLLDRQDAITRREFDGECEFCQSEVARLQNRVDALEAEVEAQRKRANDAERGVLSEEWYISRERYDDDIAELTAERDELKHANKRQAEKLTGVCDLNDVQSKRIKELEAERDQYRLNANIFADYAQRWRDEVEQLKRANRIQAESFRKMELDSKQACDALKAACRELLEVSGTCPYDSHSVQPRNCDEECKTDAAFMAGCWELYFRGDAS